MGKYIGNDISYGQFEKQILPVPNPPIDEYYLNHLVSSATSIQVVCERSVLEPNVDYTVRSENGRSILKLNNFIPSEIIEDGRVSLYVIFLGQKLLVPSGDLQNSELLAAIEQKADQTYVDSRIDSLLDGAPSALNTLNELSNALGADANFAGTVATQLGQIQQSISNLSVVATSGSYLDLSDKPTLESFTTLTSPTSGQILKYDGTNWVNDTILASVTNLNDLTDVDITPVSKGQFLVHNGTSFINTRILETDLSDTTPLTIKGAVSQTANLLEAQSSDGTTVFSVGVTGLIENASWMGNTIPVEYGGTGATSTQTAINNLTEVAAATSGHVLTKDSTSGNATWKAITSTTFAVPNGMPATPALYFINDTNTGLYRPSEDKIAFTANGQPALTVDGVSGVGRLCVGDVIRTGNVVSRLQLIDNDHNPASGMTLGFGVGVVELYKSSNYELTINAGLKINNQSSAISGLVVRGAELQTSTLLDVQNSVGESLASISFDGSVLANRYVENIISNFSNTLSPISGTLIIDTAAGNTVLGNLNDAVTTWAFTNAPSENGKSVSVSVIISGNPAYTYGTTCTVNGTLVSGGIKWAGGGLSPTASSGTDIISFMIVKDLSGVVKVFGAATTDFV